MDYLLGELNTGLMNAITAWQAISFFLMLINEGKVISGHPRVLLANKRAEARGLKVYHPYIPNWRNDELNHYIEALTLAEEKGVSIYIEHSFLEDILRGCMRITWM